MSAALVIHVHVYINKLLISHVLKLLPSCCIHAVCTMHVMCMCVCKVPFPNINALCMLDLSAALYFNIRVLVPK